MATYDKQAADHYFGHSNYTGQDLINEGFTLSPDSPEDSEYYYGGVNPPSSFYPATIGAGAGSHLQDLVGQTIGFSSEPEGGGIRLEPQHQPDTLQLEYDFRPGLLGGPITTTGLGPASPVVEPSIMGGFTQDISHTESDFFDDYAIDEIPFNLVPQATPFEDPMIDLRASIGPDLPDLALGGSMVTPAALVAIPALGTALRVASTITIAGASRATTLGSNMFGGSLLAKGLAALGLITAAGEITEWGSSLWPNLSTDEQQKLQELVNDMVATGFIQTPSARRDGTVSPMTWLHWNIEDPNSRPFLTGEYISRKFVSAVRRNERTPRFRGRPRPFRRTRR